MKRINLTVNVSYDIWIRHEYDGRLIVEDGWIIVACADGSVHHYRPENVREIHQTIPA